MRSLLRNRLGTCGMALVCLFVIFALFAPWIAPRDPAQLDLATRLQRPNHGHWFGTDELGRDILSRVIYGARISMLVGTSVVAASLLLGLIFGSIAGYYGGGLDRFFNVVLVKAVFSFSGIFFGISFLGFLGPWIFYFIFFFFFWGGGGYAPLVW